MVNSKIYDCQRGVDRNKALKQSSLEKKRKQRKAVSQFCFLKFWKIFIKLRILKTFSCVLSRITFPGQTRKRHFLVQNKKKEDCAAQIKLVIISDYKERGTNNYGDRQDGGECYARKEIKDGVYSLSQAWNKEKI